MSASNLFTLASHPPRLSRPAKKTPPNPAAVARRRELEERLLAKRERSLEPF